MTEYNIGYTDDLSAKAFHQTKVTQQPPGGIQIVSQPEETIDVKVESLSGGQIKVSVHISNSTRDHQQVVMDAHMAFEAAYTRAHNFMESLGT